MNLITSSNGRITITLMTPGNLYHNWAILLNFSSIGFGKEEELRKVTKGKNKFLAIRTSNLILTQTQLDRQERQIGKSMRSKF